MKIGIDISPLESGHKIRGVGFYVKHLKESLASSSGEHEYIFLKDLNSKPNLDILHIPFFDPFFVHLPLMVKSKLIVTVHDLTPLVLPELFPVGVKGKVKWQINKYLLSRADAIITDSDSSRNDVHTLIGIAKNKIHTVYLAAGEEFKRMENGKWKMEIKQKYNLPDRFVLYVGDVTANKNLPRLIDAIKEINLTLVLIGKSIASDDYDKSNPWNRDLASVQDKMKGDKRFIPLGFVDQNDLVGLYNIADLLVLPSLYEGFGLPVLEAMQSGCPVVTTKGGSLPEVAGDAAYYVDANDTSSIANGIGEVFYSDKLRSSLIKKGLTQSQKFTWKKTAEQTVNVYSNALK